MSREERSAAILLRTLGLVLAGTTSALLLTSLLLLRKDPIGMSATLYGSALFLVGILSGSFLGASGARSQTGLTFNSQDVSPLRQMMKRERYFKTQGSQECGKPHSSSKL